MLKQLRRAKKREPELKHTLPDETLCTSQYTLSNLDIVTYKHRHPTPSSGDFNAESIL